MKHSVICIGWNLASSRLDTLNTLNWPPYVAAVVWRPSLWLCLFKYLIPTDVPCERKLYLQIDTLFVSRCFVSFVQGEIVLICLRRKKKRNTCCTWFFCKSNIRFMTFNLESDCALCRPRGSLFENISELCNVVGFKQGPDNILLRLCSQFCNKAFYSTLRSVCSVISVFTLAKAFVRTWVFSKNDI